MGNKIIILSIGIFFITLSITCKKEKDEGYPSFPLSKNAKGWFSEVQNGSVFFRSNNGLSESYDLRITRNNVLGTFNGKQGLGEEYWLICDPALGDVHFYFRVSNVDNPEHIELDYMDYTNHPRTYWVSQWFLTKDPFNEIKFYCNFQDKTTGLGIRFIGDTIIAQKKYSDIFHNKIIIDTAGTKRAVDEIYLSKSIGLVAYRTQDSIIWFRE